MHISCMFTCAIMCIFSCLLCHLVVLHCINHHRVLTQTFIHSWHKCSILNVLQVPWHAPKCHKCTLMHANAHIMYAYICHYVHLFMSLALSCGATIVSPIIECWHKHSPIPSAHVEAYMLHKFHNTPPHVMHWCVLMYISCMVTYATMSAFACPSWCLWCYQFYHPS